MKISMLNRITRRPALSACAALGMTAAVAVSSLAVAAPTESKETAAKEPAAKKAPDAATSTAVFPDEWFYPDRKTGGRHATPQKIENKPAPKLEVANWIGDEVDLKKAQEDGKIVVVDFWGTWCPPCMKAIPKNVKLAEKYKDNGVIFLGVHSQNEGRKKSMADVHKEMGINYPLCHDTTGKSAKAWSVAFWPTYALVDTKGVVRASGLRPDKVEDAIKVLIAERDAPKAAAAVNAE